MPGESATSPRRIDAKEKQREALVMRKKGKTYQFIADELGYANASGAAKAVKSAIEAIIREPAEELIILELERLDEMYDNLTWKRDVGDFKAIEVSLKIQDRRAKLLGLDKPQDYNIKANVNVSLTEIIKRANEDTK